MNDPRTSIAKTADSSIVFETFGPTVKISPAVGLNLLALWAGATVSAGRRQPGRSWPIWLAVGAISADFGHALAHTVSARMAGAPMDEVRISQGMQRTIYYDNDVPPRTHIIRSLGGPLFNALALLLSFALC